MAFRFASPVASQPQAVAPDNIVLALKQRYAADIRKLTLDMDLGDVRMAELFDMPAGEIEGFFAGQRECALGELINFRLALFLLKNPAWMAQPRAVGERMPEREAA